MRAVILIVCVLALGLLTGSVLAGNPIKKDEEFLLGDPDGDNISTWEEFILGTDPYNPDSDNDGLPDFWEYHIANMDPADSSDAHLDFDYYPSGEGELGEIHANFKEVRKDIDVWPSNSETNFVKLMYDEDGIHYDNYEEYYRSFRDPEDGFKIKLMSTLPFDPDTDDDGLLDPDDPWPLKYPNGGAPAKPLVEDNNYDAGEAEEDFENVKEINIISESSRPNFEIDLESVSTSNKCKPRAVDEMYLADVDNDGI